MKVRGWLALSALAIAIALAGCSRADPSIIAAAPEAPDNGGDTNTGAGGPTSITTSADPGGQLRFVEETLNAAPGQPINVAFNNPSAVPHSWVLVEPGQEAAVDQAATAQGGDPTGIAGVIAGSPVVNGNGNATVNVPALEAGSYPYICTVPGHLAAGMKGVLNVGGDTAGGEGEPGGGTEPAGESGGSLAVAADQTQLRYQQESLTGTADQALTVAFENPSALPHNWVLVSQGQEEAVANATVSTNGDPTGVQGVLAGNTPITGSSATIEVPAQPAGTYSYICTVPGHFAAGMRGTLTLQP